MLASDLLANLQADLVSEMNAMPHFATPASSSDYLFQSVRFTARILSRDTLRNCTEVVEQDCIDYVVTNYVNSKTDLESRILVRFASAFAASLITNLLWERKFKVSKWIVGPLISATNSAAMVIFEKPLEQITAFIREKLEQIGVYQMLNEQFGVEDVITAISGDIATLGGS
jgi:hypothetical protein